MDQTLDFLIPTYDQLAVHVRKSALPDLRDSTLSKAILQDSALHDDLLDSILKQNGCKRGAVPSVRLGDSAAQLKTVIGLPLSELCLRLGCAGQAAVLSQTAVTRLDALDEAEIPRDILKASLPHRSRSLTPADGKLPSREALEEDGCQTLHCWLGTIPDEAARLVRLRLPVGPKRMLRNESDQRAQLCEAVLNALTAPEVAA